MSIFSALLPLVAAVLARKWLTGSMLLILWLSVASLVADGCSWFFIKQHVNTWPIINLFLFIQLVSLFIALDGQKIFFLKACFGGVVVFAVINYFFIQGPKNLNSYTSYAGGILMILTALNFLSNLMKDMPVERIQTLPLFWLSFAVLIYYGGTLFLFLFNNLLIAYLPKTYPAMWTLHNLINITKNIFLFLTVWMNYKLKIFPQ